MGDAVIKAEGLGKRYRIGQTLERHGGTLGEAVGRQARRMTARARHPRSGQRTGDLEAELWALRGVDLHIERGEVVGVIGRNGAGKSTLLKVLSRITEPTTGWVDVRGTVGSLLEVGSGFHPELSGRENVFLNGAILGMSRAEISAKFDEIVAFAEVEPFIDTPIKRYSSGMHTRLAFAVAAHLDVSVLIVDEVLAVGDITFQERCLGTMRRAGEQGKTVLFVSHNMASIGALCSKAILLEHGQIATAGATAEVIGAYFQKGAHADQSGRIPRDVERFCSGDAYLDAVTIDVEGVEAAQLFLGQPFTVHVAFEVVTEIPDAVFEIDITTLDGLVVTSSTTLDGGGRPLRCTPGVHEVAMDLDVALAPGRYAFTLGIHRSSGWTVDWVERARDFVVLEVGADGVADPVWKPRGLIRADGCWRVGADDGLQVSPQLRVVR